VGYSIQERAESIGTYRWVEIQLMETLARWVPTTPEMEVKVLFGRHVWDCAQHADALGRRAFELRAPLHFTLPAAQAYREFLRDVAEIVTTSDRVSTLYDVVIPGVGDLYSAYLTKTDPLMDEPTVRILQGALQDHQRMKAERNRLTQGVLDHATAAGFPAWKQRQRSICNVVEHGAENARARGTRA